MDENTLLSARIKELAGRAWNNDYLTHTGFLSASGLADFYALPGVRHFGSGNSGTTQGTSFAVIGGHEDAERNVVCFLPGYTSAEDFLASSDMQEEVIRCVHIKPVSAKFTDVLTHRDYLGALMNLGIERDRIGDILTDSDDPAKGAYVFVLRENAEYICSEVSSVKHTTVTARTVRAGECAIVPKFDVLEGSVASARLDGVLALVYRLSRSRAQELVEREAVTVGGRIVSSPGYELKEGARVSVRGHGKFIYEGVLGGTRKGRQIVRVRIFL